jgi:hypothetical protein
MTKARHVRHDFLLRHIVYFDSIHPAQRR